MKISIICLLLSSLSLYGQMHHDHTPVQKEVQEPRNSSVITPNVGSLPWVMDGEVKVFHLVAEPIVREFAPGFWVNCWGYNGSSPGPTIEAMEGDHVRIFVTNNLNEPTSVHWHGKIKYGIRSLNFQTIAIQEL